MELDIEGLQHLAEEGDIRKAEAAGEEVPKDHRISLLRFRNSLARRRDFNPRRRKHDSFNISVIASLVMEEGPKSQDFIAISLESAAIKSPTDAETLPKSSSTSFSNSNAEAEASMHSSKRAPQPAALTPRRWR